MEQIVMWGHMKIKVSVKQQTRPSDITKHIQAIKQGAGVRKSKKGKGSYCRKKKHTNK